MYEIPYSLRKSTVESCMDADWMFEVSMKNVKDIFEKATLQKLATVLREKLNIPKVGSRRCVTKRLGPGETWSLHEFRTSHVRVLSWYVFLAEKEKRLVLRNASNPDIQYSPFLMAKPDVMSVLESKVLDHQNTSDAKRLLYLTMIMNVGHPWLPPRNLHGDCVFPDVELAYPETAEKSLDVDIEVIDLVPEVSKKDVAELRMDREDYHFPWGSLTCPLDTSSGLEYWQKPEGLHFALKHFVETMQPQSYVEVAGMFAAQVTSTASLSKYAFDIMIEKAIDDLHTVSLCYLHIRRFDGTPMYES